MLTGGCFCGRLRHEIRATPFNATLCHCADCRRISGASAVAWFSVRPEDFAIVLGTPRRFTSSAGIIRAFCPDCGTPLSYQRADLPDEIDITTATLDDPRLVPPQDQTHVRDRLAWSTTLESLPEFLDARPPRP